MIGQMEPRILEFLPAVFRQSPDLGRFLHAIDAVLFGAGDPPRRDDGRGASPWAPEANLDRRLADLPSAMDPWGAPDDFLPWLSQWAALSAHAEARDRRRLIAEMIPLYRIRGTREYVERTLRLYLGAAATVDEDERPGLSIGVPGRARVGVDTRLGEDVFGFTVRVVFSVVPVTAAERARLVALARQVIELGKPAYTHGRLIHNLQEQARGFVVAVRATVGIDTVLEHPAAAEERQR
jgi:phage tail-like protein